MKKGNSGRAGRGYMLTFKLKGHLIGFGLLLVLIFT